MTTVDYAYAGRSVLAQAAEGAELRLVTSGGSSVAGAVTRPFFFAGFAEYPEVVAAALLVVARVARTRFYVPPNMVAAVLRAADPVVTSTPAGLRFESFSACCGVYARLDIDAGALASSFVAPGVTNVDVNPDLRQALAGLRASEPLHLAVGDTELRVATLGAEVVEEQVPLPNRWLKGFAETQVLSADMVEAVTLDSAALRTFVQGLPRSSATRTVMWATPTPRGLRLASRPTVGSVCVAGPERLGVLEPLIRFGSRLRAFSPAAVDATPSASGWVLDLPGGRLTVVLSPEKARGFSGEGAVLPALASATTAEDADLISALLAYEPRIEVALLARQAELSVERVRAALSVLASYGQVGFDLAAGAYFRRPLPVRPELLDDLHPRLADARALVGAGGVQSLAGGGWRVRSGDTEYVVTADGVAGDRCTCPWWARYKGSRGPCKHVLAVHVAQEIA